MLFVIATNWIFKRALVKSIVGGPKYGGGGTLDPDDRTRLYYGIFNGGKWRDRIAPAVEKFISANS